MVSAQKQSLNSSIATGIFGKIHSPKRKLNKPKDKSESYMKVIGLSGVHKISWRDRDRHLFSAGRKCHILCNSNPDQHDKVLSNEHVLAQSLLVCRQWLGQHDSRLSEFCKVPLCMRACVSVRKCDGERENWPSTSQYNAFSIEERSTQMNQIEPTLVRSIMCVCVCVCLRTVNMLRSKHTYGHSWLTLSPLSWTQT